MNVNTIVTQYLSGYPENLKHEIQQLVDNQRLGDVLLARYPSHHNYRSNKALYDYVLDLKNNYLKQSSPFSKVTYDDKIHIIHQALGLHTQISRVQGSKLKSKNEIRIGSAFKKASLAFLRMICVHELAHIKEKEHNKAFYKLCTYMEPDYHQLEFDLWVHLIYRDIFGDLYY